MTLNELDLIRQMKKNIVGIILFILFVAFCVIKSNIDDTNRKKNFEYKRTKITSVETFRTSGGDIFVGYEFRDSTDKRYRAKNSIKCSKDNLDLLNKLLLNKFLIVIFEKGNPSNSKIGLKHETYAKYNISLPKDVSDLVDSIESICNSSAN